MTTREDLEARARQPAEDALRLHPLYHGKVQILPKCPVRDLRDFAIWYTPGVAAPCKAIEAAPDLVYEHTNKGNTIAIVTDGTRVLGLGDIGPQAGLPVMEGKALLFKYLGGVDAVPICLGSKDPEEIVRTVRLLEPAFGGINLEDIAQPKCFRILDRLRAQMTIPVWHDDQQGTATVLLAGLLGALAVVGKDIRHVKIAMVGMGAANVATYRILKAAGVEPGAVVGCDATGTLHRSRHDIEAQQDDYPDKWRLCQESNADGVVGGIADALRGADVCVAFPRRVPASSSRHGSGRWQRKPSCSPAPTQCPRSGHGRPPRPAPSSWPPGAATFRTRSTTRSASPASSAVPWTCGRARSPTRWRSPPPTNWPAVQPNGGYTRSASYRPWTSGRSLRAWPWRRPCRRRSRAWRGWPKAPATSTPLRRGRCAPRATPPTC